MKSNGFAPLYRSIKNHPLYSNTNCMRVYFHFVLTATHSPYRAIAGENYVDLEAGQLVVGRKRLALTLGLSEDQIRTSISRLVEHKLITRQSTNKYTVITLIDTGLKGDSSQQHPQQIPTKIPSSIPTYNKNKKKNNNKNNKLPSTSYKYEASDLECAEVFFNYIQEVTPHAKTPNFESWANDVRLMREQDKLTIEQIVEVFKWANSDDFWKTNVLSTAKLRKKFPELYAKMRADHDRLKNQSTYGSTNRAALQDEYAKGLPPEWQEREIN